MKNKTTCRKPILSRPISFSLMILLFIAIACSPTRRSVSTLQPELLDLDSAILFAYNADSITVREFLYVYEKNNVDSNLTASHEATDKAMRDYLDLYINFRLKVKAAEDTGMAKKESFIQELDQYRKQLAKPYMVENQVTEQLVQEAYDRLQQEVRASHILIEVAENAPPADTLSAYQLIDSLRTLALKGVSFAMLAEQHSDDPSAAGNGGDLGYFTALQMVYPFENAAYQTEPGDISKPVRTRFGYHIVKVHAKRPARGKVKVAHILIRPQPSDTEGEQSEAYQKAQQIHEQLQKGADWNEMVERFSDDVSTRSSGGELPFFGTGNMMPAFEEAAFALKNPGDISQPFKTRFGWHIVKLIEHQETPPLVQMRATLERKIDRSVRSEVAMEDMVAKLKHENSFQPDERNIEAAIHALYASDPEVSLPQLSANLFTLQEKKATVGDFYNYVKQQQQAHTTDSATAHQLFRQFEAVQVMAYEEEHLADKNEEYRRLLKEYRDGILLFDIMEQKVWSKASQDSLGLQSFFEANRSNYRWKERVTATLLDAQNEGTLNNVKKAVQGLKMPLSEEQIATIEKRFNTNTPLALQIHQGTYEKDGYRSTAESVIDAVEWKKGEYTLSHNDRMYTIIIHDVLSPKLKDLHEIKGIVIADYQNYLDKQWIASLRKKYPVEVYENVLQQLIASYPFQ